MPVYDTPDAGITRPVLTIEMGRYPIYFDTGATASEPRRDLIAGIKKISIPRWLHKKVNYRGVTWEKMLSIEFDVRPTGVEFVRWEGFVMPYWGPGILQRSSYWIPSAETHEIEWEDMFPETPEDIADISKWVNTWAGRRRTRRFRIAVPKLSVLRFEDHFRLYRFVEDIRN